MGTRLAKTLTGLSLLLASTLGSAVAADLGGSYSDPVAGLQRERWTGFYLGGTLGYGWGEGRGSGGIGAIPFDQSGMLGTLYAGYNWQLGPTVLGLEADIGTGDLGGSEATSRGQLKSSLNAIGSFRARAGFLVSPAILLYGTAGLAWADMDFQIVGDTARSETFLGFQVGLGSEIAISDNVALRLEYIYTGLPEERVIHSGMTNTYDPSFNAVRAGVTFKF